MEPDAVNPTPDAPPPPRAFAQGTGVLLQAVGMMLFMTTCCVCSTSFLWDPIQSPSQAIEQSTAAPGDMFRDPGRTGHMLTLMVATVGGLALAGFGLGLQSDHRRAATGALISCAAMLVVLSAAGFGLWMGETTWAVRIWHAVLSLVTVITSGFVITAWRQVRRQPPPDDVDIVPPGTKIPYSFYHDDPPEVRLQKELDGRRARLEQEQRELDEMQKKLDNDS
jgi:hypothetical protein